MLVCNGVVADSRVQKTARSAAEAGWEVTLLGRSPDGRPKSWRIGGRTGCLLHPGIGDDAVADEHHHPATASTGSGGRGIIR